MKKKNGFTIVETILVLAIGTLILLAFLIAIPNLVRNQKDGERRDDISLLISSISLYQANNRKALPHIESGSRLWLSNMSTSSSWKTFQDRFMPSEFTDPNGEDYKITITTCNLGTGTGNSCNNTEYIKQQNGETDTITNFYKQPFPNGYIIVLVINAKCETSENIIYAPGNRTVAALYKLENGGTHCANN